jgi:hypothetical protein
MQLNPLDAAFVDAEDGCANTTSGPPACSPLGWLGC